MSRVILITDADTLLGSELARRCLKRGMEVVATVSAAPGQAEPAGRKPGKKGGAPLPALPPPASRPPAGEPAPVLVEWKRRTPLSAINALLQAVGAHDRLDEALVLNAPAGERRLLHETATADLEQAVDHWVKGNLFLLREILKLFRRRGEGLLALVNYSPLESGGILSPLDSAIWGGFQGLAESLFVSCAEEPFRLNGFESHSDQPGEFADFILENLQEKGGRVSGRWFRHQPRSGFLSGLRLS